MRADSKAAEGALQSKVHIPKQLFLLFKVVREQRETFLSSFLSSVSILIPPPKSLPCSYAAFPNVIPKNGTSGLLWLCPVLLHGAVNSCPRVCCSPQGRGTQTQPFLRAVFAPLLCPRAAPACLVRRSGSTKPDPVAAQLLSEDTACSLH